MPQQESNAQELLAVNDEETGLAFALRPDAVSDLSKCVAGGEFVLRRHGAVSRWAGSAVLRWWPAAAAIRHTPAGHRESRYACVGRRRCAGTGAHLHWRLATLHQAAPGTRRDFHARYRTARGMVAEPAQASQPQPVDPCTGHGCRRSDRCLRRKVFARFLEQALRNPQPSDRTVVDEQRRRRRWGPVLS